MKKILNLVVLIIYVMNFTSFADDSESVQEECIVKRVEYYVANANAFTEKYTYDNDGNIIEQFGEIMLDNRLTPAYRYTKTYNKEGKQLTNLYELYENGYWTFSAIEQSEYYKTGELNYFFLGNWIGTNWRISQDIFYNYDSVGNVIKYDWRKYEDGHLASAFRYNYIYDNQGDTLSYTMKKWNWAELVNDKRINYSWDRDGNKIFQRTYTWDNNEWKNKTDCFYTNNKDGNPLIIETMSWMTDHWVSSSRTSNIYNSDGCIKTSFVEKWQNDEWVNLCRMSYTYNQKNNLIEYIYEEFKNNEWVNTNRLTYSYNENGCILTVHSEIWQENNWTDSDILLVFKDSQNREFKFYAYKVEVTYKAATGLNYNETDAKDFEVYPNPASDIIILSGEASPGRISIYNAEGIETLSYSLTSYSGENVQIDISTLPSGVYMIKYENKTGIRSANFLIMR